MQADLFIVQPARANASDEVKVKTELINDDYSGSLLQNFLVNKFSNKIFVTGNSNAVHQPLRRTLVHSVLYAANSNQSAGWNARGKKL